MAALAQRLRGWTPVRISAGPEPSIEWAVLDRPIDEPFFEQTAERAMRRPFNAALARTTPLAALGELDAPSEPAALPPNGLIFHLSRCGSTLIAQMLAALDATTVLAEPQPLDALLSLHAAGALDGPTTLRYVRALVTSLAGPGPEERRLFVKLQASHVLMLPLLAHAFPGVPWVFVFREPAAVLRSQATLPGAEVVPGGIDSERIGLAVAEVNALSQTAYAARALGAFADAALDAAEIGRSAFIDYASLPGAVYDAILPLFGVTPSSAELARVRSAAERDTKRPGVFHPRPPEAPGEELMSAARTLQDRYAALRARAVR